MAAAAPVSEEELAARQEEIGQSKKISHNFIRNHLFLTQPDFTHQSRWLFQPRRTTSVCRRSYWSGWPQEIPIWFLLMALKFFFQTSRRRSSFSI